MRDATRHSVLWKFHFGPVTGLSPCFDQVSDRAEYRDIRVPIPRGNMDSAWVRNRTTDIKVGLRKRIFGKFPRRRTVSRPGGTGAGASPFSAVGARAGAERSGKVLSQLHLDRLVQHNEFGIFRAAVVVADHGEVAGIVEHA